MFGGKWALMDIVNRTFVGIRLPEAISSQIQESVTFLKRRPGAENVRWNSPAEYLVQIASFGELSVATLGILRNVLPPVASKFAMLRLEVRGFSGLPNAVQPRYVCTPLGGDMEALEQMARAIEAAAAPYVPVQDARTFRPYVVVGRLKTESESMRVGLGRALKSALMPSVGVLAVDHVDLLISHADTSGMGYAVVERLPLGG